MRIGHIILNVKDFTSSEPVYDSFMSALGFECDYCETTDEWAAKSYRCGEHNLWIKWDKTHSHEEFVRDIGLDHLSFFVETREKVNDLFLVIENLELIITRPPRDYPEYDKNYYAFYFRDPDGIPLEIYCK